MNLCESIFAAEGKPLGHIVAHSESGQVAFRPAEGVQPPPARLWRNVDELRAALQQLYGPPEKKP